MRCENEKPPEAFHVRSSSRDTYFGCAGPQRMPPPWPECSFTFQDGGRSWHHSCWLCRRAEHKGLGSEMLVQWFHKKPVSAVCNTVVRFLEERLWEALKLWRWSLSFKADPGMLEMTRTWNVCWRSGHWWEPAQWSRMMPLRVFQIPNTEMQPLLALRGFTFASDQSFPAVLPDLLFRMGIFLCLFVCCNNCFIGTQSWKFSFASQSTLEFWMVWTIKTLGTPEVGLKELWIMRWPWANRHLNTHSPPPGTETFAKSFLPWRMVWSEVESKWISSASSCNCLIFSDKKSS